MQHEVHRANRNTVQSPVPGTLPGLQIWLWQIQVCRTPFRKQTLLLPNGNIMETLHTVGKGQMMDTLERFYIFRETKLNNQINDRLTVKPNIIFETTVQKDPHRGIPNAYKHLSSNN
jgi:hypothetical protein